MNLVLFIFLSKIRMSTRLKDGKIRRKGTKQMKLLALSTLNLCKTVKLHFQLQLMNTD